MQTKQQTNNDWLLSDLTQILDYCVQEGEYQEADVIEGIIREARPIRRLRIASTTCFRPMPDEVRAIKGFVFYALSPQFNNKGFEYVLARRQISK